MDAKIINEYSFNVYQCDTVIVTANEKATVHITDKMARIFINGTLFAQYVLVDSEPSKKIMPFMAETERYNPKTAKKMPAEPVVAFFNSFFDNWINSVKTFRRLFK